MFSQCKLFDILQLWSPPQYQYFSIAKVNVGTGEEHYVIEVEAAQLKSTQPQAVGSEENGDEIDDNRPNGQKLPKLNGQKHGKLKRQNFAKLKIQLEQLSKKLSKKRRKGKVDAALQSNATDYSAQIPVNFFVILMS